VGHRTVWQPSAARTDQRASGLPPRHPRRRRRRRRPADPTSPPGTRFCTIALSSEETLVLIHYDKSVAIDALAERTSEQFRPTRLVANLKKRGVLDEPRESEPEEVSELAVSSEPDTAPWEQAARKRIEATTRQPRARLSAPVAPGPRSRPRLESAPTMQQSNRAVQ
jgi:hypothetical protein